MTSLSNWCSVGFRKELSCVCLLETLLLLFQCRMTLTQHARNYKHKRVTPKHIVKIGPMRPAILSLKRAIPSKEDSRIPPPRLIAVT
mmetsp:Transcript_2686/g.4309  ORF Transcript_2686/g.4309 Transcript_2686/m.4309 type:complete len:87 (+) Transcript_2686:619-879(+)